MANTSTIVGKIGGYESFLVYLQVLLTGNYANPEVLDLTAVLDPSGILPEGFFENPSIGGIFSENLNGYWAEVTPGTALNNWTITIYSAAGTKLPAEAYATPGIVSPENSIILQIPRRNM